MFESRCTHERVLVVRSVGVQRTVCEACGNVSFEMRSNLPGFKTQPPYTSEPLQEVAGL